jgi:pantoate--beta-alanine ligase
MAKKALEDNGFVIDYLETRRTSDLSLSPEPNDEIAIFGAVYLGTTRLIDNRVIPISRPDLSLPSERLN